MPVRLQFMFAEYQKVSMIRVWNYNGDRVAVQKGMKLLKIYYKKKVFFQGEIKKASTEQSLNSENYENILFTLSPAILKKIAKHDPLFQQHRQEVRQRRQFLIDQQSFREQRPLTTFKKAPVSQKSLASLSFCGFEELRSLKVFVLQNHGHPKLVSFSGLQLFSPQGQLLKGFQLRSNVQTQGGTSAERAFKKQLNADFLVGEEEAWFEVLFPKPTKVARLVLLNSGLGLQQNSSVQMIQLQLDEKQPSCRIPVLRASGKAIVKTQVQLPLNPLFYKQLFSPKPIGVTSGYELRFRLLSTFGDQYYIGLNGVEVFDYSGVQLLTPHNLHAFEISADPEGVYCEKLMSKDERKPVNLVNCKNQSNKYRNIWLTLLMHEEMDRKANELSFTFRHPVCFGLINIWNYSRTPSRAVRRIQMYIDGKLIYNGELNNPLEHGLSSFEFHPNIQALNDHIQVNCVKKA